MKKFTAAILALIMMFAFSAALTVNAADALPTPSFYTDFIDKLPANGEAVLEKFPDKVITERNNVLLNAPDGNPDKAYLQIFLPEGIKAADAKYVVAKFKWTGKHEDGADLSGYSPFMISVATGGAELKKDNTTKYQVTDDFQTMIFDITPKEGSDPNATVWYLHWKWFDLADFPCEMEIEYVATFAEKADAESFAANFDKHQVSTDDSSDDAGETPDTGDTAVDSSDDAGETPDTGDTAVVAALILVASSAVVIPVVANGKKRK